METLSAGSYLKFFSNPIIVKCVQRLNCCDRIKAAVWLSIKVYSINALKVFQAFATEFCDMNATTILVCCVCALFFSLQTFIDS